MSGFHLYKTAKQLQAKCVPDLGEAGSKAGFAHRAPNILICSVGAAKTEQMGKYLNGKPLSTMPNWFGEFGGCALKGRLGAFS